MGDRANVVIQDENNPELFLYTHWSGYKLPSVVSTVIARRDRWRDLPYLTRMIFSEMTRGKEKESTGYGISTALCDNGHPLLVLNGDKQEISFQDEKTRELIGPKYTFEWVARCQLSWPDK